MSNLRAAALLAVALVGPACASHRPDPLAARRAAMAALAQADAQLLEGCYACLIAARDTYAQLADGPLADLAPAHEFGAQALIVLREKELSIDTTGSMARLRDVSTRLPASMDAGRLIHLVDLVPPNTAGVSEIESSTFLRERMATAGLLDADVDWLAAAPIEQAVRSYLTLSLQCSPVGRPLLTGNHRWQESGRVADDPPVIAYRRALCSGPAGAAALEAIRGETPTLTEAAYAQARITPMARGRSTNVKAQELATEAFATFPQSPAVTYLMATIDQTAGDCREALRLYTATLAIRATHENAQLGRIVCLSYLRRLEEAIEAATLLISWNSSNLRDAYYWRAYNHHREKRLDLARQDIDESKRRGSSVENHTLAGIVEYEQDDLQPAIVDLNRGWSMGVGGNCVAAWYLGLVHAKRDVWPDAAQAFERSVGCYNTAVSQDRVELASMQTRTDLDAEFQRAQIAGLTQALRDDERYRWDSAMNAATSYARAGNVVKAETFLTIADEDPSLAPDVANLRTALAAPPPATR